MTKQLYHYIAYNNNGEVSPFVFFEDCKKEKIIKEHYFRYLVKDIVEHKSQDQFVKDSWNELLVRKDIKKIFKYIQDSKEKESGCDLHLYNRIAILTHRKLKEFFNVYKRINDACDDSGNIVKIKPYNLLITKILLRLTKDTFPMTSPEEMIAISKIDKIKKEEDLVIYTLDDNEVVRNYAMSKMKGKKYV